MTPLICSDPAELEVLRALLGFGLLFSGGVLLVDYLVGAYRAAQKDEPDK